MVDRASGLIVNVDTTNVVQSTNLLNRLTAAATAAEAASTIRVRATSIGFPATTRQVNTLSAAIRRAQVNETITVRGRNLGVANTIAMVNTLTASITGAERAAERLNRQRIGPQVNNNIGGVPGGGGGGGNAAALAGVAALGGLGAGAALGGRAPGAFNISGFNLAGQRALEVSNQIRRAQVALQAEARELSDLYESQAVMFDFQDRRAEQIGEETLRITRLTENHAERLRVLSARHEKYLVIQERGIRVTRALTIATGALALGFGFLATRAATASLETNRLVGEVSTLIGGSTEAFQDIQERARNLTATFGGDLNTNVRVFYQSLSAGASDAAEAQREFETASRLAIVGATDNLTALDAIIPILNVYGRANINAAEASDLLFTTVQQGRTTIAELGPAVATVIPIAQALGVAVEEVLASFGGLTFAGLNTNEAGTALRAYYTALGSISAEGNRALAAAGVDISAQRIADDGGSVGILRDLRANLPRFDLNSQNAILNEVFPNVRARNAAAIFLNLTSETFDRVVAQIEGTAEAVDVVNTLFGQLSGTSAVRYRVALGDIQESTDRLGESATQVLVPALESVAGFLNLVEDDLGTIAGIITGTFIAVAIPAFVAGVGTIVSALIGLGTVLAVTTGGLSVIAGIIAGTVFANYINGLNTTTTSFNEHTEAVNKAREALTLYRTEGTEKAGVSALNLAVNVRQSNIALLNQARVALSQAEAASVNGFGPAGVGRAEAEAEAIRLRTRINELVDIIEEERIQIMRLGIDLSNNTQLIKEAAVGTDTYTASTTGAARAVRDLTQAEEDRYQRILARVTGGLSGGASLADALANPNENPVQQAQTIFNSLGTALNAFVPGLGVAATAFGQAIAIADAIFGRTEDVAIRGIAGIGGISGSNVQQRRTGLSGFILGRNGQRDLTSQEDTALRGAFRPILRNINEIAETSGRVFTNVGFRGEDAAEAANDFADGIANQVGGVSRFNAAGETLLGTLERLTGATEDTNRVFLRGGFGELIGGEFTAGLIESLGGVGNIGAALGLRTEAQRRSLAEAEINRQTGLTGLTSTSTNQELLNAISFTSLAIRQQSEVFQPRLDELQRRLDFETRNADSFTEQQLINTRNALQNQENAVEALIAPNVRTLQALTDLVDEFGIVNADDATGIRGSLGSGGFTRSSEQALGEALNNRALTLAERTAIATEGLLKITRQQTINNTSGAQASDRNERIARTGNPNPTR